METRNEILSELHKIELDLKKIHVDCDNNGKFERTAKHQQLINREDKLMQELTKFPI